MSGRRKYPGAAPGDTPANGTSMNGSTGTTPVPGHPGAYAPSGMHTAPAGHADMRPPHTELAGMRVNPNDERVANGGLGGPSSEHTPWNTNPTPSGAAGEANFAPYVPEQANLSCPPEFLRLTMGCVPQSQELLNATQIPFGAIIHPLAETSETPVRGCKTLFSSVPVFWPPIRKFWLT